MTASRVSRVVKGSKMSRASRPGAVAGVVVALVFVILAACPAAAQAGVIERVSVADDESEGWQGGEYADVSADGRYVAFHTASSNLVANDTNDCNDIFVRDRQTGATIRVSVSSDEVQANDGSVDAAISADGRYVAFRSWATNLVADDTNGVIDVFVRDLLTGTTIRASLTDDEGETAGNSYDPVISADGRYVAFASDGNDFGPADANGKADIYLRDTVAGTTALVSVDSAEVIGNDWSALPSICGDGHLVAFQSNATNLVAGDTNEGRDIFVRDVTAGTTIRASVADDESEANVYSLVCSISADGTHVAFESYATNLVTPPGTVDGRAIYVRDLAGQTTTRVSVSTGGGQPNGWSYHPSISADGRFVAFSSSATDLVAGDDNGYVDVFVRDVTAGVTRLISVNSGGVQADGDCEEPFLSASANVVTFHSSAMNLVPGDTNNSADVFAVADPLDVSFSSLRGTDRFDTAIKVSRAMFPAALYPDGLPADSGVVLAPGWESFQEALCGAPLAAAWGGPVLLSSKTQLYTAVKDELVRLGPDRVFLIGLTGTSVADAVKAVLPSATVTPVNGTSVYHLSYLVAKQLEERVEGKGGDMSDATGIVTIGTTFPDAIGVSPLACSKQWPVLFTDYPDNKPMNAYAVQAMNELGITSYVKAGTYAPDPTGITGLTNFSGTDRYVTNQKVASWAFTQAGLTFTHTGLTTGDKFPDALAGGPYLALDHGTLLLSPLTGPLPPGIATLIATHAAEVQHFTFIAMIEPVVGQVKALLP